MGAVLPFGTPGVPLRPVPRGPLAAGETKTAAATLAAGEQGRFEGYASLFGVVDLGRDMVMPGAFAESLARRGASGIRLLWQHDPDQPIGAWLTLREDERGLFVRGQLTLAVARARELHALMREGALDGLSIGFRTVAARTEARTGVRKLFKIDLWEVSLVTFPLLPAARVAAVKAVRRTPGVPPPSSPSWPASWPPSSPPAAAPARRRTRTVTFHNGIPT